MMVSATKLRAALAFACFALTGSGCASALLDKADPLPVRYYAPPERVLSHEAPTHQASEVPLRLARVSAAAHLDVRMVTRRHNELEFHDTRRWSERPEHYLRRGLAHALFEERGLSPAVSGRALTLEARLVAFEEVIDTEEGHALVMVVWTLHDERKALVHETIRCARPVASSQPGREGEALSAALTQALEECIDRIAGRVMEVVRAQTEAEALTDT